MASSTNPKQDTPARPGNEPRKVHEQTPPKPYFRDYAAI
ncbi:hypothetical protein SAMN04488567_1047 [Limimaricola pyoseonensis]|uniref:Uncharacterized protein n=1 Tax=Limimaricola pyoseonensis TaxID=521013 RepID=A0A1G7ANT0_9RHOB|nr:hypothetical protein SAMN04488567_1047 [Limimaricola pyoseonensis]